jgi:hypothetical protein
MDVKFHLLFGLGDHSKNDDVDDLTVEVMKAEIEA